MEQFLKQKQHILCVSTVSNNDDICEKEIFDPCEGLTKLMQVKHRVTHTCVSDFFEQQDRKTPSIAMTTGSFDGVCSCSSEIEEVISIIDRKKQFSQSQIVSDKRSGQTYGSGQDQTYSSMLAYRKIQGKIHSLPEYTDQNILSLVNQPYRFKICMIKEKAKNKSYQ